MIMTTLFQGQVVTHSGSVYEFYTGSGKWWVKSNNIISETSKDISGRLWPIQKPVPWPPVLGESLYFKSIYPYSEKDNEDRMPGGGKDTGPIRTLELFPRKHTS